MDRRQPEPQVSEASTSKSFFERGRNRVIASGVTAAFAVAAFAGCSPSEATPPKPTTTHSAEVTPSANPTTPSETTSPTPEETTSPEAEVSPESLRLSADLSPQELAEGSITLWTDWIFAGANKNDVQATTEGWFNHTEGGLDEYVGSVAQKNADLYTAALLADSWESDSEMVAFRDNAIKVNSDFIKSVIKRSVENKPLVEMQNTITEVEEGSAPDGQRIINFKLHQDFENSDANQPSDQQVSYRFDITDGTARLVGYTVTS